MTPIGFVLAPRLRDILLFNKSPGRLALLKEDLFELLRAETLLSKETFILFYAAGYFFKEVRPGFSILDDLVGFNGVFGAGGLN